MLLGVTNLTSFLQPVFTVPGSAQAAITPVITPIGQSLTTLPDLSSLQLTPDCSREACIALTFDDGPNPLTTPQVLDILEARHVPATFFVVGSRAIAAPDLLRRMHAAGDEIGNHSWSHPDFTKLTPDQMRQEVAQTQQAVTSAGVPAPTLFRPPYGAINQTVKDTIHMTFAMWNEDPRDWAADQSQQVANAVIAAARPGGVIDMHDIYHVTANALPQIIDSLESQNYHFVTVSQLMGKAAGQPIEFYGNKAP